ncbi:MAG: thioesterase family protein [Deltaproteobacteria bacterium]|nr:thioesterase family protein [Deltaproteobacteria bacterium]
MLLRFTRALSAALTAPAVDLTDAVTLGMRAMPGDCDSNLHVNNARYLRLMDLGRLSLIGRLGLLAPALKNRWGAIVGAVEMEFVREINLFDRFDVVTRIVGWDKKWFYIEQRFEREGKLLAVGRVQALFRGRRGSVPTAEVIAEVGPWVSSPEMPRAFRQMASRTPLRRSTRLSITEDDLPGLEAA